MSDQLWEHVRQNPPRCVSGIKLAFLPELSEREPKTVRVDVSSISGDSSGRIGGFSLSRLNPIYRGPATLVSPISLQWQASGVVDEIFDSKIHGHCLASYPVPGSSRGR